MGNPLSSCLGQTCGPWPPKSTIEDELFQIHATNKVELACSELFGIRGIATAYHTSVVVNGEEFFFTDSGVFFDRELTSHNGDPTEKIDMGYSTRTGPELYDALADHFQSGTYDLLHKNCNSFSDCALYFLLKKRLDPKYRRMEQYGQSHMSLLTQATNGAYMPNPAAAGFDVESLLPTLEAAAEKKSGSTEGPPKRRPALFPGAQVTILGLKTQVALNGESGSVVRYAPVNGRWEVKVNATAEVKALRAENLRPAGQVAFEIGAKVTVHGLTSEAGQELNGKIGEITVFLHQTGRYGVQLGDATKSLKPENLKVIPESCPAE